MLIPKKERLLYKNAKFARASGDLPLVLRERQSVLVLGKGRLPHIVVPLPQVATGDFIASSIS